MKAWQSEQLHDVEAALRAAVAVMRLAIADKVLLAMEESRLKELAWSFVRCGALPSPRKDETPIQWADRVKSGLAAFLKDSVIDKHDDFGTRFSTRGISDKGSALKRLAVVRRAVRSTVVHRVKGESISGVLILAPEEQHAAWFITPTTLAEIEEYNVGYVAFTRAADLLVLHCPTELIAEQWRTHGFVDLPV